MDILDYVHVLLLNFEGKFNLKEEREEEGNKIVSRSHKNKGIKKRW